MNVIVPLAGPDFFEQGQPKALIRYRDHALTQVVLESRPWARHVNVYIFVLFDCAESRILAGKHLIKWFPRSRFVFLSDFTQGAALSALSAVSLMSSVHSNLIVDLADIDYCCDIDVSEFFATFPECAGIVPAFKSVGPEYSYLVCKENSPVVLRAVEKQVVSEFASAGTYIFRDSSAFLEALAWALQQGDSQLCNGLFYVCPIFNGLISAGRTVLRVEATNVVDLKSAGKGDSIDFI